MIWAIAGKKQTFLKYAKDNGYLDQTGKSKADLITYAQSKKFVNFLKPNDKIILLSAWFAKSWAMDIVKEVSILQPTVIFEFLDGLIGEKERKKDLQSESISNRFDILDL